MNQVFGPWSDECFVLVNDEFCPDLAARIKKDWSLLDILMFYANHDLSDRFVVSSITEATKDYACILLDPEDKLDSNTYQLCGKRKPNSQGRDTVFLSFNAVSGKPFVLQKSLE